MTGDATQPPDVRAEINCAAVNQSGNSAGDGVRILDGRNDGIQGERAELGVAWAE